MIIKKGSTDVTTYFKLIDPTTGAPETGLTITDLDATYVRDGAAAVKADLTALAAVDSAHGDNKAIQIDATNCPGLYRVDWPDAAFATGVNRVQLCVNGAAIDPAYLEVELVNYDPADGVRLGLTALPNAAADGVGGLPISDAGGLDMDTKLANTNEVTAARMGVLTDLIDGGRLDLLIDAIKTCTDKLTDARVQILTDWINDGRLDVILDAIKTKTDFLPSVTPGQANGLFIAGTNAAVTITSNSGHALTLSATGGTGSGMNITAAGSMIPAVYIAGGLGGAGISSNISGNITGNLSGSVNSVTTAVTATGVSDIKTVTDKLDTMIEAIP